MTAPAPARIPRPAHIVVAILENHAYSEIIGNSAAPFLNRLAASGALFTKSYAVAHPSEPNYLALFSGSTQQLASDACPVTYPGTPNLATALAATGQSFVGYADALPAPGFTGCSAGTYARKHAPWVDFPDVPAADSQPFTAFPSDYRRLPTVSFVVPDLQHDMHDGTIAEADTWLAQNLAGYARWAVANDSLLVLTWDEDDYSSVNQIPTIVVGADVRTGRYNEQLTHYRLLRTIEACLGLPALGLSAASSPVTDMWVAGNS